MKAELKYFQETAVVESYMRLYGMLSISDKDRLKNATLRNNGKPIDTISATGLQMVFPCGMGKTITLAAMLDESVRNYLPKGTDAEKVDIYNDLILWLTPGNGGLADQSYTTLCNELGSGRVYLVGDGDGSLPTAQLRGSVVVSGYESLVQKNKSDKSWRNIIMREGENVTYMDMLRAARKQRIRVTVVVDEAHIGSRHDRRTAIGQFFYEIVDTLGYVPLCIEATATPRAIPKTAREEGRMDRVERTRADGIFYGLIRDHLIINHRRAELGKDAVFTINRNMDPHGKRWGGDPPEYLVITDIARSIQTDLTRAMHVCENKYDPLMLVTLNDNPKGGDAELPLALEYFEKVLEWTVGKEVLVWTSEEKVPLSIRNALRDSKSGVKVVVTKVAPAFGWDCPRAQILVSIRDAEAMKEDFSQQLLGRIQRQTDASKKPVVEGDILNTAFAFTACSEGFIKQNAKLDTPNTWTGSEQANKDAFALWASVDAKRRIDKRIDRTPVATAEFKAAISDVKNVDISDFGDTLLGNIVSDYLVKFGDEYADIVIKSNAKGGCLTPQAAQRIVGPALTAHLKGMGMGRTELDTPGRHSGFSLSPIREWVNAQLARQGKCDADPNKVILASIIGSSDALAEVLEKVYVAAVAGETVWDGSSRMDSPWMKYLPASSRTTEYLVTGDAYTGALAKTHLFGEAKFRDGRGSCHEDAFENTVLAGDLSSRVVSWLRGSKDIDGDALSASLTYKSPSGKVKPMFPDYPALLTKDDGNLICTLFEIKGEEGSDGGDPALVRAKAKALESLYTDPSLGGKMAGAVVFPKGRSWDVMRGDGTVIALAKWLKSIGIDLSKEDCADSAA
ncbi:MAG: hypothetical protein E6R04_03370 [Spirochaetes bacterium]|nr:MAG: hypothetical protein E6R04_03370 [Spirochaetota bacterium]